ncbi:MAG: hypothetical protein AAF493_08760 [Pseudomonadota bacterium]
MPTGYEFDFGLTLDLGCRLGDEDGIDSEPVGALATYSVAY